MATQLSGNVLSRYHSRLPDAVADLQASLGPSTVGYFQPSWRLPERGSKLDEFFSPATLSAVPIGEYRSRRLLLLDMTGNPRTRTTKTFGSLVIVARALQHIAESSERVMLVTPSAANKAVALRDAVLRAYEAGLATPDTLRVVTIVPDSSLPKIWDSPMATDPHLAAGNPLAVYPGAERESVKKIATAAVMEVAEQIHRDTGFRIWYTLDPRNYMLADVVRAFYEHDVLPPGDRPRWHSHACSSGYGFLGHDLGRRVLERRGVPVVGSRAYLMVQHLATPDLVVGHRADGDNHVLPEYVLREEDGLFEQKRPVQPNFPEVCYAQDDQVERTFYTRQPPTLSMIRDLISRSAGDGIVVSLPECLARYAEVRRLFAAGGMDRLPTDPRRLREWAMVMAGVGTLNAIDRGLIADDAEVLIHGSGAYSEGEYQSPDRITLYPVEDYDDFMVVLRKSALA